MTEGTHARRAVLLAAGAIPLLAACGGRAAGRTTGNSAYTTIDQADAVDHGPIGAGLPDTPTLRRIRDRGVLLQSGSVTMPGFGLMNPGTGKITGFDAGIAQLLAKYLLGKPEVDTITGGADTREAILQNHSVDVAVSTYTIKKSRARLVNFAGPYYLARSGVLVAANGPHVTSLNELAGRDVAVQPGAAEEALHAGCPAARPVVFEESSQCAAAVRQGRVQAWSANTAILLGKAAVDGRLRMTPVTFGSSPFGIGMPKDDPEFKRIVVGFLDRIVADGTWRRLWEQTVGVLIRTPAPEPPQIGSVPGS
ncbi:transporter substrate-binding domain-containing protein [Amycolatopsis anabasis]|uniref:transporter substrate-binding domain-containing protein n=1 Tax=Amycolatopsis anabasis TaxID=1840409 RepID=UPI00131E316F|nr:transporter substrate-binding domain-containing protein [Amycolatopsis anabasis]